MFSACGFRGGANPCGYRTIQSRGRQTASYVATYPVARGLNAAAASHIQRKTRLTSVGRQEHMWATKQVTTTSTGLLKVQTAGKPSNGNKCWVNYFGFFIFNLTWNVDRNHVGACHIFKCAIPTCLVSKWCLSDIGEIMLWLCLNWCLFAKQQEEEKSSVGLNSLIVVFHTTLSFVIFRNREYLFLQWLATLPTPTQRL